MKTYKHVKEKIVCDICKKNITSEKSEDYHVYDVNSYKDSITLNIIMSSLTEEELDICEKCKAKALLLSFMRKWKLSDTIYPLFKTEKDDCGMKTFIKKVIPKFRSGSVNWIMAEWIKGKFLNEDKIEIIKNKKGEIR